MIRTTAKTRSNQNQPHLYAAAEEDVFFALLAIYVEYGNHEHYSCSS